MNIDKFAADHARILQAIDELRTCAQLGVAEQAANIARLIASMTATVTMHLNAEDKLLYPALRASSNPDAAALGARYQTEMGDMAQIFLAFSQRWRMSAAVADDPEGFRSEANRVFAALHARIQRENTELYPLARHE